MKNIFANRLQAFFLFFLLVTGAEAALLSDPIAYEHAANMATASQRVVKSYLYIGHKMDVTQAQRHLKHDLTILENGYKHLQNKSGNTHADQLEFMAISLREIKQISTGKYNEDDAYLLMDLSESILESIESIMGGNLATNRYGIFGPLEQERFLVQRLGKLYISIYHGFNDFNTKQQMKSGIEEMDKLVDKTVQFQHQAKARNYSERLAGDWQASRKLLADLQGGKNPKTVFLAIELLERQLTKLADIYRPGK